MKLSILTILIILIATTAVAQDDDPGLPTITLDPIVQICWHGEVDSEGARVWTDTIATEIVYSSEPVLPHRWFRFGDGDHFWQCLLSEGHKVAFIVTTDIEVPEGAILFVTYYEIRVRCIAYEGTPHEKHSGSWSIPGKLYVAIWSGAFGPVHIGG